MASPATLRLYDSLRQQPVFIRVEHFPSNRTHSGSVRTKTPKNLTSLGVPVVDALPFSPKPAPAPCFGTSSLGA